jgi:hypothetical protein
VYLRNRLHFRLGSNFHCISFLTNHPNTSNPFRPLTMATTRHDIIVAPVETEKMRCGKP